MISNNNLFFSDLHLSYECNESEVLLNFFIRFFHDYPIGVNALRGGLSVDRSVPFFVYVKSLPDEVSPAVEEVDGDILYTESVDFPCVVKFIVVRGEGIWDKDSEFWEYFEGFGGGVGAAPLVGGEEGDEEGSGVLVGVRGILEGRGLAISEVPEEL